MSTLNLYKPIDIDHSKPKLDSDGIIKSISYHHTPPASFYDVDIDKELKVLSGMVVTGGKYAKKALVRLNTLAN